MNESATGRVDPAQVVKSMQRPSSGPSPIRQEMSGPLNNNRFSVPFRGYVIEPVAFCLNEEAMAVLYGTGWPKGTIALNEFREYCPWGMADNDEQVIEVPYTSLSPDTLRAVVEELITRAGTDYGERERSLESKVADVMRQLQRGEAKVVFDPKTSTVNIVLARR